MKKSNLKHMTNEDYLDSEEYWKETFKVQFIKANKDGTEHWEVHCPLFNTKTSCNSMLQSFRICYVAQDLLNNDEVTVDNVNSAARQKAEFLILRHLESYCKVEKFGKGDSNSESKIAN